MELIQRMVTTGETEFLFKTFHYFKIFLFSTGSSRTVGANTGVKMASEELQWAKICATLNEKSFLHSSVTQKEKFAKFSKNLVIELNCQKMK